MSDKKLKITKPKIKMNSRTLRYGSYATAVTAVVVALIIVFNALLGWDTIKSRLRFDITANKMFSLSDESIEVLNTLEKDIQVYILTEESNFNVPQITEVLKQYEIKSGGKITTQYVDVEKDPTFIKRELDPEQVKGITSGSMVVRSGGRIRVVNQSDLVEYDYSSGYAQASGYKIEQAFTNAFMSVSAETTPVVYFVTGHGEAGLDEQLTSLKTSISANNYDVQTLSLTAEIPADAAALIFASPKSDLLASEYEKLLAFMEQGGDALFLMDVQDSATELANFQALFERYSLAVNNDFVMELDQNWYYSDVNIIIPQPASNDVTTNLDPNSLFVYIPNCRSVTINQVAKEWITTSPLFYTSSKSQSTSIATSQTAAGPFLLGALSEYSGTKSSKVALIGNSTFVTDSWISSAGENGKRYVVSILNWMEDKTNAVYIPSTSLAQATINMTEQSKFIAFIMLTAILPLLIIGAGVFVWMRRKHL